MASERTAESLFSMEGPLCGGCPLATDCGASATAGACSATWGDDASGGPNAHHVLSPETEAHFVDIGGSGLRHFAFARTTAAALPPLTHWIRPNAYLASKELSDRVYVVGLDAVVGRRRVLSATELRDRLGLWSDQRLVLAPFGRDSRLEELWANRQRVIREIAQAGYWRVLGPSYSIYEHHPPSEWLLHAGRSYWFVERLQQQGAAVIPRAGWIEAWQVEREAELFSENPQLEAVSLDFGTLRGDRSWQEHLDLLEQFDFLTGSRLTYVINGPSTAEHVLDLYRRLTPRRVRLLSSRYAAYPARGLDVAREVARARAVWEAELHESRPASLKSPRPTVAPCTVDALTSASSQPSRPLATTRG